MNDKIAIVTVLYNNYTILNDFFNSLKNQDSSRFHVFVADLSTEPQQYPYLPFVTLLKGPNGGYAYGVNRGIQKAIEEGYEKFVVINSDVYVAENFVEAVQSSLANHKNTLLGGKIYYAPGYEYHKDTYSKNEIGKVIWFAGGKIDWANMITSHTGVDEVDKGQYETQTQVDFITGCFMAYPKSVIDTIGQWDETWFLYYEDTDYSVRAARAGIRLLYDPSIMLWHKNAQSTGGSGSSIHTKYQEKNRLTFGFKYAPLRTRFHLAKNAILSFFS